MIRWAAGAALLLAAPVAPAGAQNGPPAQGPSVARPAVLLQGLDKVTARVSTITASVDETVSFGALEIRALACFEAPPTEPPESAAFLVVDETSTDAPAKRVFSGWMYASEPTTSAMADPVYDVWVLGCADAPPPPGGPSAAAPTAPVIPGGQTSGTP